MPIMGRSGARVAAAARAANVRSWRSSRAPSASQAAGGARSQSSAVVATKRIRAEKRTAAAANVRSWISGRAPSAPQAAGGASGGKSPVVVTAQPRTTPQISEAAKHSSGNYTIKGNGAPTNSRPHRGGSSGRNSPVITLPGTQIKVTQKEWDEMRPIKTPDNIPLTGNAQVRIASQEKQAQKAAAGDHLGAYKESVAAKKAQSAIEEATSKTINPNAEKVTLTEILRTDPLIGNAFTAVQDSISGETVRRRRSVVARDATARASAPPTASEKARASAAFQVAIDAAEQARARAVLYAPARTYLDVIENARGGAARAAVKAFESHNARASARAATAEKARGARASAARAASEKARARAEKKAAAAKQSGGKSPVVVTAQPHITPKISESAKQSGGKSPVVVTAQPHITPKISESAKHSSGNYTIKGNSAPTNSGNEITKAAGTPNYQQVLQAASKLPLVGGITKTIETVTVNPKTGEFAPVHPFALGIMPLVYAQRLNEWNKYDGSGKERAVAGMDAALTVGIPFGTGALVGAGVKAASLGLAKAATTKAGQNIVPKLTTPLIKGEGKIAQKIGKYSTPVNIGVNSAAAHSIADTSVRIGKKFAESPEAGAREAANAILSLPLAIAGGGVGYKLAEKVAGAIKTRGLTYIPAEKYTVEGIPLSNQLTQDNLAVSFEKNIFYPKPDKFAETNKAIQDVSSSAKLPKHPSQTVNAPKQMYHASNKPFGKEFEVMESKSEIKSIMYGAPKAETYFTRISGEAESKPGLLFNIEPSTGGEILNLKGTTVKKVDYDIAARDLGIPIDKIKASPYLQYKSADYYIQEYGKQGEFYIPGIKAEYEAGTKAGTRYKRLPARYYTEVNGIKVRISEYEPVLTETAAPKAAGGKAGKPQKVSYTGYSGKPQEIPVSYSLGVSSKLQASFKESSRRAEKTTKQVYSSRLGKPSVGSYSSLLGGGKRSTASGVESISSIVYGGNPQRGISSTAYSSKKKKQGQIGQLRKKHDDKRGTDIDFYSAARRGRIDHLSIVDPLEFLGRGSMTNRKRADVTLDKQKIYLVDSNISLTKPAGRRRK